MISLISYTYSSSGNSTFDILPPHLSLGPRTHRACSPILSPPAPARFICLPVPHYLPLIGWLNMTPLQNWTSDSGECTIIIKASPLPVLGGLYSHSDTCAWEASAWPGPLFLSCREETVCNFAWR